jgi:hypothetical protein
MKTGSDKHVVNLELRKRCAILFTQFCIGHHPGDHEEFELLDSSEEAKELGY